MWLENPSSGRKDTMLTLATYASVIAFAKLLLNGVTIGNFSFGTIDASLIAAILAPTLSAYSARKWMDKSDKKKEEVKE